MNTFLEVRASTKSTVFMGLTNVILIGSGIYFFKGTFFAPTLTLGNIFIFIFMGLAILNSIRIWIPLFDQRPYLKLVPEGLWLRDTANPFQQLRFIPWDKLYFFHFYTQKRRNTSTDYIAFRQKDTEKDINIVISGADTSAETIAQILNEYADTYHFYDLGFDTRNDHW